MRLQSLKPGPIRTAKRDMVEPRAQPIAIIHGDIRPVIW
jgi:hypothetical protein